MLDDAHWLIQDAYGTMRNYGLSEFLGESVTLRY
jgi:hypothetical protein